jgi:hypothetical protein
MIAYVLLSNVLVRNPESRVSLSCIADDILALRQPLTPPGADLLLKKA